MIARAPTYLALLALVPACAADDGTTPCPSWTHGDAGRCVLRDWLRPDVDAALSIPGAREVQAALGNGGDAVVAWSMNDSVTGAVFVAEPDDSDPFRDAHARWSATELRLGSGVGLEPAVAVGPGGEAIAAWKQQAERGAIHLAERSGPRSGLEPASWRVDEKPISWSETAYEPRVAFARDGETVVLWNQWTGTNFSPAVATRSAGGDAFAVPDEVDELLAAPVNYSNAPRLAIASDGAALVTWYQAPIDDLMVYVSERTDADDRFSAARADDFVSAGGAPVDSHVEANAWPAITDDDAAVVWTQVHGDPWDIAVYVARREPTGAWRGPASLADTLSTPGAFARCPNAAFGGEGELFVTWYETRDDDTAVFAWRDDEPSPLRLSDDDRIAVHPSLAIGPDGGVAIAWAESAVVAPDTWQVVVRRFQPESGRWLDTEPLSTIQAGLGPTPQVVIADDGAVLVAWAQGGVIDGKVYVATMAPA